MRVGGEKTLRADTSSRLAATLRVINHPQFEVVHLGVEAKP